MDLKGRKVFVGLSGGVDSAVTAALVKKAGAYTVSVFIKGWYPPGMPCTWAEDRKDAMRVAARLGIPFATLDASEEYKRGVIDYLLSEYKAGRTPNPDVMCNREVKFGAFYRYAHGKGADLIATGHYARMEDGKLLRGIDPDKDQSYFLWAVPGEALSRTLFPLGSMRKADTRALATRFNLPNARKKDSQGICFLGSISVDGFLMREFGSEPGIARGEDGQIIGTHSGALLHTLGERVSLPDTAPGPWYVARKDIKKNELIVSRERTAGGSSRAIELRDTNWLLDVPSGTALSAQYRYHGPLVAGRMSEDRTSFAPDAALPEPLASGQSLVLYDGERLVGGGIIGTNEA